MLGSVGQKDRRRLQKRKQEELERGRALHKEALDSWGAGRGRLRVAEVS